LGREEDEVESFGLSELTPVSREEVVLANVVRGGRSSESELKGMNQTRRA
jgi:hypothetical protein